MVLQSVSGRYIVEEKLKELLGQLFPEQAASGGFDIKVGALDNQCGSY